MRYLTQVRMIRRERERGSRRDVYVVMDDAWHDVLMQTDQLYRPILAALVEARGALGEGTRAGERMQLSVEFLEFVTREMARHRRALGRVQGRPRLISAASDLVRPGCGSRGSRGRKPQPTRTKSSLCGG